MSTLFIFNNAGAGGLPPFPPPAPEVRVLLEDPGSPGIAQWRCLRAVDLCTIPPGFSVTLTPLFASPVEIGAQIISPTFNAFYNNGVPISAVLSDSIPNVPQNVLAVANPLTMPFVYQLNGINTSVLFTLTADDGGGPKIDTTSLLFLPLVYWGTGPDGLSTEGDIEGLASSNLQATLVNSFTESPGPATFIYYAFPSAFGTPTFVVNGFPGGFVLEAAAVPVTANTPGAPINNYDLWKSALPGLGTTNVVVS